MGPARCSGAPGARASRLALERALARTWLLQIDSVNVFARAHHLPVFTRTGTWDPAVLDIASRPGPQRRRHLASPPRHPARKRLELAAHPHPLGGRVPDQLRAARTHGLVLSDHTARDDV